MFLYRSLVGWRPLIVHVVSVVWTRGLGAHFAPLARLESGLLLVTGPYAAR